MALFDLPMGENDFAPSFGADDFGLTEARSTDFGGLLLVTLSDAAPNLDDFLGRIGPALCTALSGDGRLGLLGSNRRWSTCPVPAD